MLFSSAQRHLAKQALEEAEGHTADYYRIPPHRWQKVPYDFLTRGDPGWVPLPDSVFARTQLVERIHPRYPEPFDFYRIQLNDPTVIEAARRNRLSAHLYPLLVCILTHEMVHLVRLSSILDPPERASLPVDCEEARVERISRQILSRSAHNGLTAVLEQILPCPTLSTSGVGPPARLSAERRRRRVESGSSP